MDFWKKFTNWFNRIDKKNRTKLAYGFFITFLIILATALTFNQLYGVGGLNEKYSIPEKIERGVRDFSRTKVEVGFISDQMIVLKTIMDIFAKKNIQIILIEPCILWEYLDYKDHNHLYQVKSVPSNTTCGLAKRGYKILTLGLFELLTDPVEKVVVENVAEDLKKAGFNVGLNASPELMDHLFIGDTKAIFHVAFFNNFGNIHKVVQLKKNYTIGNMKIDVNDLHIGMYDAIFDIVSPTKVTLNSMEILVPEKLYQFLFELPHSKHVDCAKNGIEKERSQSGPITNDFKKLLRRMMQFIYEVKIPFWVDNISLKDWVKYCSGNKLLYKLILTN